MQQYFEETRQKEDIAKSVYSDEGELLRMVIRLHCPNAFELDPTYSTGNFYKGIPQPKYRCIPQPKYRFDIEPQTEGVVQADCRKLPLENESVVSIMFDPPFVAGIGKDGKPGIIRTRFGSYKSIEELWEMYRDALKEFHRLLKPNGMLVFKCQDTISSGKQYLSHVEIINQGVKIGFYVKDLFILLASNRVMSPNMDIQYHARKFHSYYIVMQKRPSRVNYTKED